ncbi:solute:Na+ symporter, SSS family [Fodinibius roseus]|uniref:Solute:Na+ symporter, SSS family n=1 Tax=Fodinibius roseus TaxID=1194090 RepID=A0A1M5D8K6_9BACT|nr:sodium:solute symporter [Fodinibius roseus]SHF63346.1 solute:Na+ symporter, SSS family [Fodinibius roseus]
MGTLAVVDWIVIGLYFLLIAGLAWWVIKQKTDTTTDYFLAGRHLGWIIVGTSIFASNIGSEHLVGLTGTGATDGVAMAHYELHAWCLLVLGWVMLPFYIRSRVFTMPEFLEKRFSPLARTLLSGVSLLAYVLTKIAVGIFAGGIVFSVLIPELSFMGMNSFWIGSILVIVFTGLYTVLGGLRAVAYTEAVQTLVLIFGSVMVLYYGLDAIGGWNRLYEVAGPEMFDLWKPIVPDGYSATWAPVLGEGEMAWYFNSNYPWLGMLFAAPIVGLWYWTTDQYIVQRALGAPNEKEGRRGTIAAAFLKLLPVFLFIIPGIIAFALAKSGEIAVLQEALMNQQGEIINENAQASFPLLVAHILPVGIRGIVVAGLLAALMSSLAGVFNASSTLFTMDFYSKFRPDASEQHLVWMGRLATVVMVVIGLLWIPVIQGSRGLYDYLQGVQAYLAPPIFVVFFFGIFFKRLNKQGALSALVVGLFLGIFRLAIDTPVMLGEGFAYAEGSFFWIVNNIFFQYYSLFIFLVCIAVMFGVSYMTDPPKYEKISGLTYGTLTDEDKRMSRESWNWVDISLSVLLVAVIGFIYIYFSG